MQPDDLPPSLRTAAHHVFACSEFVTDAFARDAALWPDLARADALGRLRTAGGAACWPEGRLPEAAAPEPAWQAWLRA